VLNRVIAASILIMLALMINVCAAHADSMLTSPPDKSDDGLIFVDEDSSEGILKKEAGQDDFLCVTLKKKTKIWGPSAKGVPGATKKSNKYNGKYSSIFIQCKVYVKASNTGKAYSKSYKYSKKLSSRGRKRRYSGSRTVVRYMSLDITPIIIREAKKNNLSPILLKAVIQAESRFNPYAVSPSGALGLCQLMPRTARYMGVRKPFDPEQNIIGGAKYLGLMKKKFKSLDLLLAAYNAGPGTVRRAGGVPNIYQTKRYIIKVKRNMRKW